MRKIVLDLTEMKHPSYEGLLVWVEQCLPDVHLNDTQKDLLQLMYGSEFVIIPVRAGRTFLYQLNIEYEKQMSLQQGAVKAE